MPLGPLKIGSHHRRTKSHVESPSTMSPVIVVNDTGAHQPTSILKTSSHSNSTTPTGHSQQAPSVMSDMTGSTSSASGFFRPSRALSATFSRSDTVDSRWSVADDDSTRSPLSTPATSQSSLGAHCPLPESDASGTKFPFFVLTLSSTSTLQFIALPTAMRAGITAAVTRAWKKGIKSSGGVEYAPELMSWHQRKGCDGGVWELVLKDSCWNPKSEDKVSSKRIILNIMTEVAHHGYSLESSYRASAKDSGKDTLIFSKGTPDPHAVFFSVCFYSSDRIWIIDASADVGQALEEGIKATWVDGVRDARVRERHCRELRLRGNPWTSHSAQALISSRVINVVIMKLIRMAGYDYVGSVQVADNDESEIPMLIFRLNPDKEFYAHQIEPISEAAAKSMSIGR